MSVTRVTVMEECPQCGEVRPVNIEVTRAGTGQQAEHICPVHGVIKSE